MRANLIKCMVCDCDYVHLVCTQKKDIYLIYSSSPQGLFIALLWKEWRGAKSKERAELTSENDYPTVNIKVA